MIKCVCDQDELILKDPAVQIRVAAQSASSIDIVTKAWCKNEDYWTVNYNLVENVKTAFDENGISHTFQSTRRARQDGRKRKRKQSRRLQERSERRERRAKRVSVFLI